jgi:hypothetical protein
VRAPRVTSLNELCPSQVSAKPRLNVVMTSPRTVRRPGDGPAPARESR